MEGKSEAACPKIDMQVMGEKNNAATFHDPLLSPWVFDWHGTCLCAAQRPANNTGHSVNCLHILSRAAGLAMNHSKKALIRSLSPLAPLHWETATLIYKHVPNCTRNRCLWGHVMNRPIDYYFINQILWKICISIINELVAYQVCSLFSQF